MAPNLRKPISRRFCTRMHSCAEICSIVEKHFLRSLSWHFTLPLRMGSQPLRLDTLYYFHTLYQCFGVLWRNGGCCFWMRSVNACQALSKPSQQNSWFLIFCSQWLEGSVRPLDFSHGSSVSQAQRVIVGFRIW